MKYFFDGETEDVSRSICRLVNENRPHSCVEDLMKEYPDLGERKIEVDNWNIEGDRGRASAKADQEREPNSYPLPLTPVTPIASRRFPTPKRQRRKSENNNNVFGIIGVHPGALYGEYCKERDVLDAQVKATQLERMKKEEERGRAAKELEDITEQCRQFSIAETQSLVRKIKLCLWSYSF